jgi:hypothetical protein
MVADTPAPTAAAAADKPAAAGGSSTEMPVLSVKSLRMIASSCR